MKRWILFLLLLLPAIVWADCKNPIGRAYHWDGITVSFLETYGPGDGICIVEEDGNPYYFPYSWNGATCQTTLLHTDPLIYLNFQDDWFEVGPQPRFQWVTSTD